MNFVRNLYNFAFFYIVANENPADLMVGERRSQSLYFMPYNGASYLKFELIVQNYCLVSQKRHVKRRLEII